MKRHLLSPALSAAAILLLAGCASSPKAFGPAYNSDFGYTNTQIEQDRFRVSYTSRDGLEARDFALLRAAQIADNEGYSHFRIVNGGTYDNGPRSGISTGIGIGLGGGRYNRSGINLGVRDLGRALEGDKVTEEIEVILLPTNVPNDPSVFSAQSVIKNIVPVHSTASTAKTP
ncbi:MAG: hypothetical protein ABJO36_11275 [Litorimonas sp.]